MPPAFNLSQDQTLKFNPGPNSSSLTCWHSISLLLCKQACKLHQPSTHTYRLFMFLKSVQLSLICRTIASQLLRFALRFVQQRNEIISDRFVFVKRLFHFLFSRFAALQNRRQNPETESIKTADRLACRLAAMSLQQRSETIDPENRTVNPRFQEIRRIGTLCALST